MFSTKLEFPVGMYVDWQPPATMALSTPRLADWLLHTGSLTERLQALCQQFTVQVIGQQHAQLHDNERVLLSSNNSMDWQVREVILRGDGVDWVFARSVLPQVLCEAALANLGNKPLGQRIFNDPEFVRSEFEVGRLQGHPFAPSTVSTTALYARRSLFRIGEQSVLVAEAFLPECPCYADD